MLANSGMLQELDGPLTLRPNVSILSDGVYTTLGHTDCHYAGEGGGYIYSNLV